jgi:hypothetical protein
MSRSRDKARITTATNKTFFSTITPLKVVVCVAVKDEETLDKEEPYEKEAITNVLLCGKHVAG